MEAIMCDPNASRLCVWVLSACPSLTLCALVIGTTYSSLDLPGICLGLCHVAESEINAHVHLHHPTKLIPTEPTGLKSAVTPSWKSSSALNYPFPGWIRYPFSVLLRHLVKSHTEVLCSQMTYLSLTLLLHNGDYLFQLCDSSVPT